MKQKDISIALIGGSGFLGSSLQNELNNSNILYRNFDLSLGEDHKNYVNVTNPKSLEKINGVNVLINLAAVHRDDVRPISKYDEVNVLGAENICQLARNKDIKTIVFTSSVAIYGFAPPNTDEGGETAYFNDYGRTKWLAEQVYSEWYSEDTENRRLIIIRPTVIFGEGNRGNVYNLLNQIASKKFAMFGKGENIKSMAYVENVAEFIKFSLSFDQGKHIYNYIDKPDLSMNALVSLCRRKLFNKESVGLRLPAFIGYFIGYFADVLSRLTKKNLPVSSIRVKKFMSTTQFNTSISETGFKSSVSLEEGLEKTLEYEFIQDNFHKKTFETE
jgi:nucleoside-diphosphate-sugar epimerase